MRIRDLARETVDGRVRVAATYTLERCDLPEQRVVVECRGPASRDLEPSPDAFLLLGLPLACWMGEDRVEIEGVVCTALKQHLEDAMRLWVHWYERVRPVSIEPTQGSGATSPRTPRRTATLFSGGLDSLANLRANRDAFPIEHPDAIREAVFLDRLTFYDFDADEATRSKARWRNAQRIETLQRLAAATDLELTVLTTNARQLYPDWPSYRDIGWGALMLAHTHLLSARFTDVHLSSTGHPLPVPPHGSHPVQDALFSTAALRARHPLPFMDRLTKLALVADWPDGLAALDVCFEIDGAEGAPANCGACSKCFRTMLGLVALGHLADTPTFPRNDLTAGDVKHMPIESDLNASFLEPLIPRLADGGRADLAEVLQHKLYRWRARGSLRRRLSRAIRRTP